MKKLICAILIFALMPLLNVYAAVDMSPKKIEFTPVGGGKYIYCNNHEFIRRKDLCDTSNKNARYIMNNTLEADKYAMFVSHVNHTELRDASNNIIAPGFDIELDVYFKAIEDTEITITSLGFEVPDHSKYYYEGFEYSYEEAWGCMNAWADYLEMPIRELDSGNSYVPNNTEDIKISLKQGESFWLSEYIYNYREVPFYRPVHLLSNFTVEKGVVEANIAAVKSTGKLGDRTKVHPNPGFGIYEREKQYKGIADTLNKVTTSVEYTIADWTPSGEFPVMVYNPFVPDGKELTKWFTHLNPYSDPWNKENAASSDMLEFKYIDDNKLKYYGKDVPDSKKDNVWVFANNRNDYTSYPGVVSGYKYNNYIPNDYLNLDATGKDACNLGNYGVSYEYKVTIKNEGKITRYVNYNLNTTSNNIVILKDATGNPVNGYAICKGEKTTKESDTMACVELPGETTTTFFVEVILPTNYVGGMENSLVLSNQKIIPKTYSFPMQKVPKDFSFTGREYIKWDNYELYKSFDRKNWTKVNISPEFEKAVRGNWSQYEFLYTDNGYMVKASLYDSKAYSTVREYFKTIFFLNDDFSLDSSYTFYQYPNDMSYADGVYYVTSGGSKYSSVDKQKWTISDGSFNLPVNNKYSYTNYKSKDNNYFYCDGTGFLKGMFEGEKPDFIEITGDTYYYVDGNNLYLSPDGMYFDKFEFSKPVTKISKIKDTIYVNDECFEYKLYRNLTVRVNDNYIIFKNLPYETDGISYAPYEFLKQVTDAKTDIEDSKLIVKKGTVYVPVAEFAKVNGFDISYDESFHRVTITTK